MDTRSASGRTLRWFDLLLRWATIVLVLPTIIIGGNTIASLSGRAYVTVPATVEPPFDLTVPDDTTVEVLPNGHATVHRARPSGDERSFIGGALTAHTTIAISRSDRDTRVVLAVTTLLLGAALWTGLICLRRIVRSSRRGNSFDRANVQRLRLVGALVLAWPIVLAAAAEALDATIDASPSVDPMMPGPGWWIPLLMGLGLLALAEVWREGVELRELERETI
jgi:hypothetical protein